MRSECCAWPS